MSDWHDEFTEPMHDTPADKDPLIAAMEAAGYTYDGLESTKDNLRFFGEGGQVITMGGWLECHDAVILVISMIFYQIFTHKKHFL